MYILVSGYMW